MSSICGFLPWLSGFFKQPHTEAALKEAAIKLRDSQALLREAFDLLENHGFKKEAQEVIELTRKIEKVMGRL